MPKISRKKLLILSIVVFIAMLHVFGPERWDDVPWKDWYYSYFSDLSLPFAFYFLFCISADDFPWLRPWQVRAGLVFGLALAAEMLQLLGVDALGVTFDLWDIFMYATGVGLAALLDRQIFPRLWVGWNEPGMNGGKRG